MKKKLLSLFTVTFLLCTSTLDSISVLAEADSDDTQTAASNEANDVKKSENDETTDASTAKASTSAVQSEVETDTTKATLNNSLSTLAATDVAPADIVFTNSVPTSAINSGSGVSFTWSISTIAGQKEVHTGDKIVLNIASTGLDYSTLKFDDTGSTVSEYFQLVTDSANNQVILKCIKSMTFTSSPQTVISMSGKPTKLAENTDKKATYPFTSQFIAQAGQTIDYTADNMTLSVLNSDDGYPILGGGSFGTRVWGEVLAASDNYHANDAGLNNTTKKYEYYYNQGAQNWTSGFFNSIGYDYEESGGPYTYTVTTNYPIETSSIKLSRGQIHNFVDGSDKYSVTWLPENKGFTVTFPKLYNGAAFAANYYVVTGPDSNNASVVVDSKITDGSGKVILEGEEGVGVYKYVPNGAFIPIINTTDETVYTSDAALDLKTLATASDQTDGDITKDIVINDGGFNQAIPGVYTITYSVTNKAGNSVQKTATVTVLQDQQKINGEDFSMYVGDPEPTKADFKASATDKTSAASAVTIDLSKAALTKAGVYDVTITSADGQTKIVKLTVKANEQSISGEDFSMYVGDPEPTKADFKASATNKTGAASEVDISYPESALTNPGVYDVTITSADGQTKVVKLTVKANEQSISGEDFSMYVGDPEPTKADFQASATDKTGAESEVKIDLSKADLTKAGVYDVTITSADGQTKIVKLTVKAKPIDPSKGDSTSASSDPKSSKSSESLPHTGEISSSTGIFMGVMAILTSLALFRKKNKQ